MVRIWVTAGQTHLFTSAFFNFVEAFFFDEFLKCNNVLCDQNNRLSIHCTFVKAAANIFPDQISLFSFSNFKSKVISGRQNVHTNFLNSLLNFPSICWTKVRQNRVYTRSRLGPNQNKI